MPGTNNVVQFIIKVSKFCNLRCKYCFEYPWLGDRAAMGLEQLEAMYVAIRDYYADRDDPPDIELIWHGGEPLLLPSDFYRATIRTQRAVFGGDLKANNLIQTNLVKLDDDRIALLADFFDGVGVSLDLFGDLRVDITGRCRQKTVLANMDRLTAAGVPYGCITVLSDVTKDQVGRIFDFYARLGVGWRMLPLCMGAAPGQHENWGITAADTLAALKDLADRWFETDARAECEPIATYVADVLRHRGPNHAPHYYQRREREHMIVVDVDGELYSHGDAYEAGTSWGNIFTTPLREIFASRTYAESVRRSEHRMAQSCANCEYFGGCNGFPVAEDNFDYPDASDAECPVVRPLLRHIEQRLEQAKLVPAPRAEAAAHEPAAHETAPAEGV